MMNANLMIAHIYTQKSRFTTTPILEENQTSIQFWTSLAT